MINLTFKVKQKLIENEKRTGIIRKKQEQQKLVNTIKKDKENKIAAEIKITSRVQSN
jgi:hypothetical protein